MTLFRVEVIDAQRRKLWGDVKLSQPPSFMFWTVVICAASAAIILFMVFGTYVRKETVTGFLTPEGGIVQVVNVHGGRITNVLVKQGDHVREGEALLTFTDETSGVDTGQVLAAQLSEVGQQVANARTRKFATTAQMATEKSRLISQIQANSSLQTILQKRITQQQQIIDISNSQLERYRPLAEKGYATQNQLDQIKLQVLTEQAAMTDVQQQIASLDTSLLDLRAQLATLPEHYADSLAEANTNLSVLEQKRIDYSASKNLVERAPVSGTVSNVQGEIGQSPVAGLPLLSLMPDSSSLQAELLVPTRAVGFLKVGDQARLQIDAYPYERYGFVTGRVISISHSVMEPGTYLAPISVKGSVYRVRVALDRDYITAYGQHQKLRPGLSLIANIVIDKKPLWRQLFDPILAAGQLGNGRG